MKLWRCNLCGWLNPPDAKGCASCVTNKPRARKKKEPPLRPSFRPWQCVLLAVDTANTSGWSLWSLGKHVQSGEIAIFTSAGCAELFEIVHSAKMRALELRVPLVVVCERSWGGHMGTAATAAFGAWKCVCINNQIPASRLLQVYPATWRARVLPKGMHGAPRATVRKAERVHASNALGDAASTQPDACAAYGIGCWAVRAGEVGMALPKSLRVTT